jgi:hypothetical protein
MLVPEPARPLCRQVRGQRLPRARPPDGGSPAGAPGAAGTRQRALPQSPGPAQGARERAEPGGRLVPYQTQVHPGAPDRILEPHLVLREGQPREPPAGALARQLRAQPRRTRHRVPERRRAHPLGQRQAPHGQAAHVHTVEAQHRGPDVRPLDLRSYLPPRRHSPARPSSTLPTLRAPGSSLLSPPRLRWTARASLTRFRANYLQSLADSFRDSVFLTYSRLSIDVSYQTNRHFIIHCRLGKVRRSALS